MFNENEIAIVKSYLQKRGTIRDLGVLLAFETGLRVGELSALKKEDIIPSLTLKRRINSHNTCNYGHCGCLFVCIDMYYIFDFVLFIFFVFEIIPRMEAFDINSRSVLNPNEL